MTHTEEVLLILQPSFQQLCQHSLKHEGLRTETPGVSFIATPPRDEDGFKSGRTKKLDQYDIYYITTSSPCAVILSQLQI